MKLFNLIAQSDSLINVSLAKDSREMAVASKQDSSAMKIIALLTTFFLPGTFIAVRLGIPSDIRIMFKGIKICNVLTTFIDILCNAAI